MPVDKFYIGPFDEKSGLQTNMQPWMISDNAWAQLNNAYVWRGRVRKRFGSQYMIMDQTDSRLRFALPGGVDIGITDPITGNAIGIVPGNIYKIGQMFQIGTVLYTVTQAVGAMLSTGIGAGTYNTATGAYNFVGAPLNSQIYFYPAEPVMGLPQYEIGAINNHPSYAFDTQFSYIFAGGFWQQTDLTVWHSTNDQFFWSTTWAGITDDIRLMFSTNFNATVPAPGANDDPIRFWNNAAWADFTPKFLTAGAAPSNTVQSARIIIAFKDRLLLLNTIERSADDATNIAYVNRCRYSQNGSPVEGANPTYDAAWLEGTQVGSHGAGFVDATTEEAIVSAEFIKDRLIVYFERSTWELAYNSNEVLPFSWQKINTELGSQSLQSSVPFDKVILTIGNTGVHACTGANVQRVDETIPDQIFNIQLADSAEERVAGIRDYFTEMVYWTMATNQKATPTPYPNRVLVYNYTTGTWAFNDDCITAFGYFEQQGDVTWATTDSTWQEYDDNWISGLEAAQQRVILAGNQEGFVYRLNPNLNQNEHVMQVTLVNSTAQGTTFNIRDHTFAVGDFFHVQGTSVSVGTTDGNGNAVGFSGAPLFGIGQYFIVGTSVYTSITAGVAQPMQVNGIGTGTYDTTNGAFTIANGPPNTQIIFYGITPSFSLTPGINNIDNIYQVAQVIGNNLIFIPNLATIGLYNGGLTVSRVSQIQMLSKQWNFYNQDAQNVYIQKIDFNVTKTTNGQLTVDYYPSSTELSMIEEATATESIMGTNVLETSPYALIPLEQTQERLWHPVYFQSIGETLQIFISLTDAQMISQQIAFSGFELNGLIVYANRSGRLQ